MHDVYICSHRPFYDVVHINSRYDVQLVIKRVLGTANCNVRKEIVNNFYIKLTERIPWKF